MGIFLLSQNIHIFFMIRHEKIPPSCRAGFPVCLNFSGSVGMARQRIGSQISYPFEIRLEFCVR